MDPLGPGVGFKIGLKLGFRFKIGLRKPGIDSPWLVSCLFVLNVDSKRLQFATIRIKNGPQQGRKSS